MDVKSVALQLRKLSSDPDNQVYIVNEKGCMKGLLGFLDSNDPEVLGISLQALQFLSSHPLNKEPLSKMDGLLPKIVGFTEHESESVRRVAAAVLDNMQDIVNGGASSKPVALSTTAHHPVKPAALPTSTAKPNAAAFTPSYLYSVPLQIKERLSQTQLTQVERALLQIKGVVSITVNSSEVMVYCRCQDSEFVQVLLAAIKNLGLTAIAGQGQDESKVPPSSPAPAPFSTIKPSILTTLATASLQSRDKENSGSRANAVPSAHSALGPAYLTPAKPAHGVADPRKALVEYTPYGTNRTESRAEQRKASLEQQQQKNSTVRSLFGAVTSYFW